MKKALILFFVLLHAVINHAGEKPTKFAIITDIHHDIAHDAPERLETFLKAAKENKVDFIIELGDFCFAKDENLPFINLWKTYTGEKYHVLGNHDMDITSKEEHMKFVGMPGRYYSFDKGDFHFIILDGNNIYENGKYTHYNKSNYYIESSKIDYMDPEQLEWLKKDLASTNKLCILFSHQCLENTVQNREEVRKILEDENQRAGFKKVVVAFSGHDHTDYTKEINGITYIQVNSASNQWVGDKYACPERFSEEINKRRPAIQYTVPYKDALYGIVTVDKNGLNLIGVESSFIPPTPEDLGIPADRSSNPLVPRISDVNVSFIGVD